MPAASLFPVQILWHAASHSPEYYKFSLVFMSIWEITKMAVPSAGKKSYCNKEITLQYGSVT
jgi:hypothetical protein